MKSLPFIRPLAFLTVLASFALAIAANAEEKASPAAVVRWEYRVVSINEARGPRSEDIAARDKSSQDQLNALGQEGWELVAVREHRTGTPVFYFKRPLP